MDLKAYWAAVTSQDAAALARCFHPKAKVRWPNTGEEFTAAAFIRINCAYPGAWAGELLRVEEAGDTTITLARIQAQDGSQSLHVTSFFTWQEGLILELEEYFSDDGPVPQWRQDMKERLVLDEPVQDVVETSKSPTEQNGEGE